MSMPDALAEDRAARSSDYAWMLDRFVCPASRLERARRAGGAAERGVWDGELPRAGRRAGAAAGRAAPQPPEDAAQASQALPGGQRRVLPRARARRALARHRAGGGGRHRRRGRAGEAALRRRVRAERRTGGARADLLPRDRRGHEGHGRPSPPAAQGPRARLSEPALRRRVRPRARRERGRAARAARCRGACRAAARGSSRADEVRSARERLFKGFGSCSWREPVDDLRALGWLE